MKILPISTDGSKWITASCALAIIPGDAPVELCTLRAAEIDRIPHERKKNRISHQFWSREYSRTPVARTSQSRKSLRVKENDWILGKTSLTRRKIQLLA